MPPTIEDLLNEALAKEAWGAFVDAANVLWNAAHLLVPGFPAWSFGGLTLAEAKSQVQTQCETTTWPPDSGK